MSSKEDFHSQWLGLVQQNGLVVSPRVLAEKEVFIKQSRSWHQYFRARTEDGLESIVDLYRVLNWNKRYLRKPTSNEWVRLPDLYTDIFPEDVFIGRDHQIQLYVFWSEMSVDDTPKDQKWVVSNQTKVERYLQRFEPHIGLHASPDTVRLCYAPPGEVPGSIDFPIDFMQSFDGQVLYDALCMLVGERRLNHAIEGQSLRDLILDSRKQREDVTTELGHQAVDALELLTNGFKASDIVQNKTVLTHALSAKDGQKTRVRYTGKEIYESLSTLLLRMIFLLYAEERGLLPVDNPLYAENYSILALANKLEEKSIQFDGLMDRMFGAYAQIITTCNLIYTGVFHDELVLIERRGELFNPEKSPVLYRKGEELPMISDQCIHEMFTKLRYLNGTRVSYKNLLVEQIGSIYEQLLELHIEWKKDDIHLNGAALRKDTGAHYTPRVLCDFIVQETLSKVISSNATSQDILALRVCDPAMGSGAFLAASCRYLAKRLVECWSKEGHPNTKSKDSDIEILARIAVAEKCLYGVDLNPRAVQLAKLSIWLETSARDKPFTFLDHSLKAGNSVIGLRLDQMQGFSFDAKHNTFGSYKLREALNDSIRLRNKINSGQLGLGFSYDDLSLELVIADGQLNTARLISDLFVAAQQKVIDDQLKKRDTDALFGRLKSEIDVKVLSGSSFNIKDFSKETQEMYFSLSLRPFHWEVEFPEVIKGKKKGFDAMVGNPPFINCIRGNLPKLVKTYVKQRYSYIKGSADLSYYFLELASELIHKDGTIGLILPRVSMGASALQDFRISKKTPKPCLIYSANHHDFFANAAIKVVAYIFAQSEDLSVSDADLPAEAIWVKTDLLYDTWWKAFRGNWWGKFWFALQNKSMPDTSGCKSVVQMEFEVHGGLTTGDFYKIQVEENKTGKGLRLITSGGIDPNVSYWGSEDQTQKFNKSDYIYPRIIDTNYDQSLKKKLQRSRRPKLIIANLTKEVEVFFDRKGEYQGSTATQTIFHKKDDLDKLEKLCALLHSDYGNLLFHAMLEYNAMHSNISMEKSFLENFPIPKGVL